MKPKLLLPATALAIILCVFVSALDAVNTSSVPETRDVLREAQVIQLAGTFGPESLAFDPKGEGPYTGVADGRILKWGGDNGSWIEFAVTSPQRNDCVLPSAPEMEHVCGRPLGLKFHSQTGELYIADAYFGLQMVGSNGGLATKLATEAEGEPFRFTNDLDLDEFDDSIYFTDSSTVFQRRQFMSILLGGDNTGRLMKYDKTSKNVTVLLRGLAFPNGVALSKDRSFVLVAETTSCKVMRFWLSGPKAGTSEVFAELPGFPDNIRRNEKGEFWVALHSKKGAFADFAISNRWFGERLLRQQLSFTELHSLIAGKPHAIAMKLSEEGKVMEVLEDSEGRTLRFLSEVDEKNGKLWIGSVMVDFMGIYSLN